MTENVTLPRSVWTEAVDYLRDCANSPDMADKLSRAAMAAPQREPVVSNARSTGWIARKDRYMMPVLFNPYTGEPRDVRDVQSDPQGTLIVPPGSAVEAAHAAKLIKEQK